VLLPNGEIPNDETNAIATEESPDSVLVWSLVIRGSSFEFFAEPRLLRSLAQGYSVTSITLSRFTLGNLSGQLTADPYSLNAT
jgi:hypothetical protein